MKKTLSIVLVLVLVLGLSVSALAANHVTESKSTTIAIDGKVSSGEWGDPVFSGNLDTISYLHGQGYAFDCTNGWAGDGWGACDNQSYDVFATKDSEYAYIAVRINNSGTPLYATDSSLESWRTNLTFTLGAYNPETITEYENNGVNNDVFSCIRIGEMKSGTEIIEQTRTVSSWATNGAMTDYTLASENFSINYDDVENSYTYEVRVPLSQTNIKAEDTSFVFTTDFYTVCKNGQSLVHYILGGGSTMGFDVYWPDYPNTNVHGAGYSGSLKVHPFIVKSVDYKIGTTASEFSENIKADGVVTEDEWGEPVIVTDVKHTRSSVPNGAYWEINGVNNWDQTVKIYATNDNDNIYLAMTMDYAFDNMNACPTAGDLWGYAHFGFNIGQYEAGTLVPQINDGSMMHDQWTGYFIGMVNGVKGQLAQAHGLDPKELPAENYEIKYDATAKTWTYEVILPMSYTNIDLEKSQDIAISFDITDGKQAAGGGNRYLMTQGYFNSQNFDTNCYCEVGMEEGGAFKITLNEKIVVPEPPVVEMPECYVLDKVQKAGTIKIDGSASEEEWGKPVIVTNPLYTRSDIPNGLYWEIDGVVKVSQTAKIYMTNDKDNIYIAMTLDNAYPNTTPCTDIEAIHSAANFGFALGSYNKDTTVETFEWKTSDGGDGLTHEVFTGYWLGMVNGAKAQKNISHGMDQTAIPDENYAIKYDETEKTWTYEVKLPVSYTNIDLNKSMDIAFTATIGDGNASGATNRYHITQGFENAKGGDGTEQCLCEIGIHEGKALKFTLNDTRKKVETFVKDTAPAIKEAVKLDGVITDKEWGGTAVVSTTPAHCQETWGNFWEFDPSSVNQEQNAKLYVTNDSEYLYIGATLDEADLDTACKNVAELYKAAHFNFSVSGYDETNTVKRIPFEGKDYEQYTGFMMGLVNGKPASYTFTQGHAAWELPAEDYAIKYDEATRTYTYEVRIPFAKMNVTTNKIAISASIGAPYTGGDAANRYNLTTGSATCGGAENWAHKNNAIVLTLSNNPETGDINVFAVVAVVCVAALGVASAIVLKKRTNR